MNKLEEYRDKEAPEYSKSQGYTNTSNDDKFLWTRIQKSYKVGFDAAIALDLPVKFAEWLKENKYVAMNKGWATDKGYESTEQLYKYWIDNVYKPE